MAFVFLTTCHRYNHNADLNEIPRVLLPLRQFGGMSHFQGGMTTPQGHLVPLGRGLRSSLPYHHSVTLLDSWVDEVDSSGTFQRVVVCSAHDYRHFERWSSARSFPLENLVNTGTTIAATDRTPLGDAELAIRTKCSRVLNGNIAIFSAFVGSAPDRISQVLDEAAHAQQKMACDVIVVSEDAGKYLNFHVDLDTGKLDDISYRKGFGDETEAIPLLFLRPQSAKIMTEFLSVRRTGVPPSMVDFVAFLIKHAAVCVAQTRVPVDRAFITLRRMARRIAGTLNHRQHHFLGERQAAPFPGRALFPVILCKAFSRAGLMGNPSDQMDGKSMAISLSNFWSEATIRPSSMLRLVANPVNDPMEYAGLHDLHSTSSREGYSGGLRLLQATCKKFYQYCLDAKIDLPRDRNFTLSFETNVPRQVGLAGSSCIITAVVRALMLFFGLTYQHIPQVLLPSLILSVELDELGIHAGLMDRVAQVYEGFMTMDFDKQYVAKHKYGKYERLPVSCLPKLHLAYAVDPSDSGKKHNTVKQRWFARDPEVVAAARTWAGLVDSAVEALRNHDHDRFASLVDQNFDLRRKIYGDASLGWKNLRMVAIAREHGAAAKFPGSGGAIIVVCRKNTDVVALQNAYEKESFTFVPLLVQEPQESVLAPKSSL